jgi:hypothetical protein
VFEDPATAWSSAYCLRPYHPYRLDGMPNPAFEPSVDGRLLDFKNGDEEAIVREIVEFRQGLERLRLPRPTLLLVVPAHTARDSTEGDPLARAAHGLAALDRRFIPAVDMLIRVTTIPRRATGGERTTQSSRASMRVQEVRNSGVDTIVLLEDTVTTGTTIAAARQLLRQAGARRIGVVALARTVKYYGSTAGYHESTVRTR